MKKFILFLVPFLFLIFLLGYNFNGCYFDSVSTDENTLNTDIPADPGTPPPPLKTGYLMPSVGIDTTAGNPDRIRLNVGGLLDPSGNPIAYSLTNLTVVEDTTVKGIKITDGGTACLGIDIVFAIDVTGSMASEINGVKSSVLSFLDSLKRKLFNVRCGVVAFADNMDQRIPYSINGIADSNDPGAYSVMQYRDLDTDLTHTGQTFTFINGLYSSYLGYTGGDTPEGSFDALWFAYKNFHWRHHAQKIFILITDAPSWGKYAPIGSGTTRSPWRTDSLAMVLSGKSTVHVISVDTTWNDFYSRGNLGEIIGPDALSTGKYDVKYLAVPGSFTQNGITYYSNGTGGVHMPLPTSGYINLNTLPIRNVISGSSLVEFVTHKPHGTEKKVRIVIDLGGTVNGEVTLLSTY